MTHHHCDDLEHPCPEPGCLWCQTCGGRRRVEADYWDLTDPDNLLGWVPCPVCSSPGNVETS